MRDRRPARPPSSAARKVLLDSTFVHALLAEDDPAHAAALAAYDGLITRYVDGHDLLLALSTVLDTLPREFRRDGLAPVSTLHVAGQHRRAAARVMATNGVSADTALTVVLMRRERIRTIATSAPEFHTLDVTVIDPTQPATIADLVGLNEPRVQLVTGDVHAPHAAGPVDAGCSTAAELPTHTQPATDGEDPAHAAEADARDCAADESRSTAPTDPRD